MKHTMQLQANQPMTTGVCAAPEVPSSAETVYQRIKTSGIRNQCGFKANMPAYLKVPDVKLPCLFGRHL